MVKFNEKIWHPIYFRSTNSTQFIIRGLAKGEIFGRTHPNFAWSCKVYLFSVDYNLRRGLYDLSCSLHFVKANWPCPNKVVYEMRKDIIPVFKLLMDAMKYLLWKEWIKRQRLFYMVLLGFPWAVGRLWIELRPLLHRFGWPRFKKTTQTLCSLVLPVSKEKERHQLRRVY